MRLTMKQQGGESLTIRWGGILTTAQDLSTAICGVIVSNSASPSCGLLYIARITIARITTAHAKMEHLPHAKLDRFSLLRKKSQ